MHRSSWTRLAATASLGGILLASNAAAITRNKQPRPATIPPTLTLQLEMHLPGPQAGRWLNVSYHRDDVPPMLDGCVSVRGSCRGTMAPPISAAQRVEFDALLLAMYRMPRCEPEGHGPDDREAAVTLGTLTYTTWLPSQVAQIPASIATTRADAACRAPARLAVWIARLFGQLPP